MTRKAINRTLIIGLFIVMLGAIACGVYLWILKNKTTGEINAQTPYYLSFIRTKAFFDGESEIEYSSDSYFQFADDKQTGKFYFGDTNTTILFIITQYKPGLKKTSFRIAYIHNGEVVSLNAVSSANSIVFKRVWDYDVGITQEHPDETDKISYETTVLEFIRG